MKDSSAFLDMRGQENWVHKVGSRKHLTIWRPVCLFFPKHRAPHSCSPPRIPSRGCWKPAAAAAWDLVPAEVDGKGRSVVDQKDCQTGCLTARSPKSLPSWDHELLRVETQPHLWCCGEMLVRHLRATNPLNSRLGTLWGRPRHLIALSRGKRVQYLVETFCAGSQQSWSRQPVKRSERWVLAPVPLLNRATPLFYLIFCS